MGTLGSMLALGRLGLSAGRASPLTLVGTPPAPPPPPPDGPDGSISVFGYPRPGAQPADYGARLLPEARATVDDATGWSVQADDPAIAVGGGRIVADGSQSRTRWARATAALNDAAGAEGDVMAVVAEVSALSGGSMILAGRYGAMSGSTRSDVGWHQAVAVAPAGASAFRAGPAFRKGARATVERVELHNLSTLLARPQAIFLVVSQSNWVGNGAGRDPARHPPVAGAVYWPGTVNRSQGADTLGAAHPRPMLAMEPMQHQTSSAGAGPGAAFCREARRHVPAGHTVSYVATGHAGHGLRESAFWNPLSADHRALDGFWARARDVWAQAPAGSYVAGVIVCIGESDLGPRSTAEHGVALDALLTGIRAEPGWGEMPVVISEIGVEPGRNAADDADVARLNDEQRKFATGSGHAYERTRCAFVPRPAGGAYTDGVHYDDATNVVRGTRAAAAWETLSYPR